MAKVHITLVGGQPAPVFQGIKYSNPNKIIYICSEESKKEIENIQNRLDDIQKDSELDYDKTKNVIKVVSVEDVNEIKDTIQSILDEEQGNEISMNLSSGVKVWSMLFQQHAPESAHVYCISQNCNLLTTKGKPDDPNRKIIFSMVSQCKLLNSPLNPGNYIPYEDYTDIDQENYKVIAKLYEQSGFPELLNQMMSEHALCGNQYFEGNQFVGDDLSYIEYNSGEKEFTIQWNDEEYHIRGPHAASMLLDSGWIKYAVATLLKEIYGPENIYTNCIFTDTISMDIIVNTGIKLIFIECQIGDTTTGDDTKIYYKKILDTFKSNINACGGLASKALFMTLKPINICKELCKDTQRPHLNYYYIHHSNGNLITKDDLENKINEFINTSNL